MQAKKKAEAEEHLRLAAKALKTSITKWSPDHDLAGDEYSKAATCYKVSKCWPEAIDALDKACEEYKHCKQLFQAAKMLEQSVLMCKESNNLKQIPKLAERGGLLYRQHGSPESAAQLLEKAAKIVELSDELAALELYQKSAETIMVEDRPKQAAELLNRVAQIHTKQKNYDKAAKTLEDCVKLFQESGSESVIGRTVSGLILCYILTEDIVAAAKAYNTWGGYCEPNQGTALNNIIQGLDNEDPDLVKQGVNSNCLKHLDIAYARALKEIKIPTGLGGLEEAAKAYGAERATEIGGTNDEDLQEHNFGVESAPIGSTAHTKEQKEEEAKADLEVQDQARALEEEDDDDDEGLC